ncbi:MAG TPA: hypothetical protein VMU66_11310 [Gaiellales bacterium]|nr:hypothetical protein [Gaiellales bacterium]
MRGVAAGCGGSHPAARARARPPEPQVIVFSSGRDGNYEIFSMHSDGSDQTRLTRSTAQNLDAAVSPAGRSIAFVRSRQIKQVYAAAGGGSVFDPGSRRTGRGSRSPWRVAD